jgi:glycosyltransferase involved in cell wall biosynthesis
MKIVHVPFCFYPDPSGGTEVYVKSLASRQQQYGANVVIAAPGNETSSYEYFGLPVRRFAISNEVTDLRVLYGEGDVKTAQAFAEILDEERPDIVHMHAFTREVSVQLLREARRRGIKVIFTYHTPTVSCQRGTLLRWGAEVCDGKLDASACAACTLHAHGLSKTGSVILGSLPKFTCDLVGSAGLSGGAWTALRMTGLTALRHAAFRALMNEADQIVALCQWTKDLLVRNNVPVEKIAVSRHGIITDSPRTEIRNRGNGIDKTQTAKPVRPIRPIRIAFLGRMDRTKGPDTLISALRSLPEAPVELHLYGIVQDSSNTEYLDQLKQLAGTDRRISLLPPVPGEQVVSLLQDYHLLAVPSRWLETGPLVALEAFAAGTPVIGSNLGGIAELIEHEVNGMLVDTDSVEAWSRTLRRCYEDRDLLEKLRRGINAPREMSVVAQEMLLLYERSLGAAPMRRTPGLMMDNMEGAYAKS